MSFGDAYLRATRRDADPEHLPGALQLAEGSWTWRHVASAARLLAASCLSRGRRLSRGAWRDLSVRARPRAKHGVGKLLLAEGGDQRCFRQVEPKGVLNGFVPWLVERDDGQSAGLRDRVADVQNPPGLDW